MAERLFGTDGVRGVAGAYPLARLAEAQERFASKDFVGKLVVEP